MTEKKYRVHDLVKFNYSEIGEYIGEDYTDKPLRNDEIVDLLNEQHETIQSLISDSEKYRKLSIQFDNRNKELVSKNALLEKENEQLKSELDNCKECLDLNRSSCARHMKENEQLKQSNKDAWELIQFIYNEIKEDGSMDWGRLQDLVVFE